MDRSETLMRSLELLLAIPTAVAVLVACWFFARRALTRANAQSALDWEVAKNAVEARKNEEIEALKHTARQVEVKFSTLRENRDQLQELNRRLILEAHQRERRFIAIEKFIGMPHLDADQTAKLSLQDFAHGKHVASEDNTEEG